MGAGKEVAIALLAEAVYLAKAEIAKTVHGVGFPALPELIKKVVDGKMMDITQVQKAHFMVQ
jgi:hypothetical protein